MSLKIIKLNIDIVIDNRKSNKICCQDNRILNKIISKKLFVIIIGTRDERL